MIDMVWLVLGYICNNRCGHCYARCNVEQKKGWMSKNFAKEVLNTLKSQGLKECLFIGGEPSLFPGLEDLVSFGFNLGIRTFVVSNGRRFSDFAFAQKVFSAGLSKAIISVEGATKDLHNSITGCDSFSETIDGIKQCASIGNVNTLTTICESNASYLTEIVELSQELGAGKAVFNCVVPVIPKNGNNHDIPPDKIAEAVTALFREVKKRGLSFSLNATFPLCLLEDDVLEEMLQLKWLSVGCQIYRGKGVAFDCYGNILPCTHFSSAPLFRGVIDDKGHFVFKDSFCEMWADANSVAGKLRSKIWRYPAEKCKQCKYWGDCIGGCPLLWTRFNPTSFIDRKEVNNGSCKCS